MTNFTAEARRHGEESGDRKDKLTAETRRRGEETGDWENAYGLAIGETPNIRIDSVIGYAACICHPERVGANATPSRRIPTKIIPEQAASGSSHEAAPPLQSAGLYQGTDFSRAVKDKNTWALAPELFKRVVLTIRAMVREIFDESAYDRFLLRTSSSRSVESYRQFTQERDAAMLKKPRCC